MDIYQVVEAILVWIISGLGDTIITPLFGLLATIIEFFLSLIDGFFDLFGWDTDIVGFFEPLTSFIRDFTEFLLSDTVMSILTALVVGIVILVLVMLQVIIFIYMERKIFGRIGDRRGPKYVGLIDHGFLQQIADALKLFLKEIITPEKSDKMLYHVAPVILISSTLMILAALPFSEGFYISAPKGGILFIMAMFAVAPIAILVGGWASNNKYTLIGGMRSAAMMMSYEIPLLLTIAAVIILAGTFDSIGIVQAQSDFGMWYGIPMILGFIIFMICIVAEVERIPFDLPEAEAELVEGWTTEYGGMRLGLIWLTEYTRMYCGAAIGAILFLGGWSGPTIPVPGLDVISGEIWISVKIYIIILLFIWIRWSLPRVRTDQILHFGWRRLLPLALFNVFIAIGIKILGDMWGWF
ncbi:MAG: NADH-quinone oxidoreductase subunit NuoH [Thermoplasmata archaeon]|nr:MAG: NADH-quinone oxidoreductase subunit NuoH [Thermoplasmata archaeon]